MPSRDSVQVNVAGLDAAMQELDQLARVERSSARLDGVLDGLFDAMRATVPVKTGRLKASGHAESHVEGDEWHGRITFGEGIPYLHYVYPARQPSELDYLFGAAEPAFWDVLDE